MLWWLKQLCSPLNYLRIRIENPKNAKQGKFTYDYKLPGAFAVISVIIFLSFQDNISISGDVGILNDFKNLLQLLIPFFIAALAAVSTFQNPEMEKGLDGYPALLKAPKSKEEIDHEIQNRELRIENAIEPIADVKDYVLTRRQFVCYLFGYLSFLSFFLFSAISLAQGFSSEVRLALEALENKWELFYIVSAVRGSGVFVFSFLIGNLLVTTLLGLYFLTSGFHKLRD